jgi:UTP:GlnB (protein PII) uridylyltransferase
MLRTTIDRDDVATVGELLAEIGQGRGTPDELRDAAIYWSAAIDAEMECADLQTIAWLLRDASAQWRIPPPRRDRARYWAAYLEGRMAS